jgi:hypothetical protein
MAGRFYMLVVEIATLYTKMKSRSSHFYSRNRQVCEVGK